ncbi:C-type lectin domain family 4 member D-like [Lineus longissimus]|uniref:C-type lectin domain family 4 member D-like n=1 Tax=Lineus longissimus TaxID=88925 RepID=UPI00315C616D
MDYKFVLTVTIICAVAMTTESRNITMRACGPRGKCTYDEIMMKVSKCFANHLTIDEEVHGKKPLTTLDALEARLTRQMEALSIRTLRGVRRIETKMQELTKTGMDRRLVRLDAEAQGGSQGGLNDQRIISERSILCNERGESNKCPTLFTGIDGWETCYLFSNFNATWQQARDYCAALGANLVVMETNKEHYLVNLLIKQKMTKANGTAWWTAGNYQVQSNTWMWATQLHLQPFRFHKWKNGTPKSETTKCMLLPGDNAHTWISDVCTEPYNFICETSKIMKMK